MKIALFAIAILAQISAKPPTVQVRAGTVQGTVTVTADNPFGDPEPILKGTCAHLVATAKIGPLTSKAKATGDLTTSVCAFSIPGVGEGGATVSLAFEGADFPAGDLASTPVTVRNGETSKVAMAVKWPKLQKQNVSITFDFTSYQMSCNAQHVKITGLKTLDVQLDDAPPKKCSKLVGLLPGTYTFQLFSGVNPNASFQPQTMNVVVQPFFPVLFKLPEQAKISARFYPKIKPPACANFSFEISQGNVVKETLPFKSAFGEHCYTLESGMYPTATPLDLKIKAGNSVLFSAQKTISAGPNANMWEVHE